MNVIRYEVKSSYRVEVVAHECNKETDKCLWVKSVWGARENWTRRARKSEGSEFFETWESAHAEAIRIAERKLEQARQRLDEARSQLETVKALRRAPAPSAGEGEGSAQ